MEELVTCENCGNVWDGFAQCDCYIYMETELQIMDFSPPSNFHSETHLEDEGEGEEINECLEDNDEFETESLIEDVLEDYIIMFE